MEQLRFPEISPSDSEDYVEDYWFTSPSTSVDGSSVNSIPWADDVVNKNQEIWERIERMFYGEETLPTNDDKLRNEIQQWTTQFPYLRVIGTAMPIYSSGKHMTNDPNYEEVISMHPLYPNERQLPPNKTAQERLYRSAKDDQHEALANNIGKCLRITSGPLLTRRIQNKPTTATFNPTYPTHMENGTMPPRQQLTRRQLESATDSIRSVTNRNKSRFIDNTYGGIGDRLHSIPYSARIINVPAKKIDANDSNESHATNYIRYSNIHRIKTATLLPANGPLRTSITLPLIDIEPNQIGHNSRYIGESISALIYPDMDRIFQSSFRDKYKKRSESE